MNYEVAICPVARKQTDWLPAVEVRGEGIFFEFAEATLADWEEPAVRAAANKINGGQVRRVGKCKGWRARFVPRCKVRFDAFVCSCNDPSACAGLRIFRKFGARTNIQHAIEWRRALVRYQTINALTTAQLCDRLRTVGIQREEQTVEGWLRLERNEPVGPRHIEEEIRALWQLVDSNISACAVSEACSELRSLHRAAGRAIIRAWAGRPLNIDIESGLLDEIVARLRSTVEVHELESVRCGSVPPAMLGLWAPAALVANYVIDL